MDKKLNIDELLEILKHYHYAQLHIHHTWKPSKKDFNGNNHFSLQEGMRNYHVNTLKWSDIGQHVTLMPDGVFVTGRDFEKTPASIKGWNKGAFAVEMLGDFDKWKDELDGEQLESILKLINYFVVKYGKESIKFHRDNSSKTCPGTSLNKNTLISLSAFGHPERHWAYGFYQSLISKGIKINEKRFDDKITRGEVFALLDQIVK